VPFNPLPRVLCVDDDEDSRLMLITLLRSTLIEAKAGRVKLNSKPNPELKRNRRVSE